MRMYKTIAIVVLGATFAALTFAAPAFADTGSGFVSWGDSAALEPGNAGETSPHGGYATNTVKCAVCHAVHAASPSGEVLLRSTVADACTFCHVETSVSSKQVYNSVKANYTGAGDNPYGHQYYGVNTAQCIYCHQVHAASDFMTLNDDLTQKILSGPQVQDPEAPGYDPRFDTAPNNSQTKDEAITEWCTKCHKGDEYGYYSPYYSDKTHVMKAPDVGGYAGDGEGGFGKDVAWVSSENCSSCHKKGNGTSAWPHFVTSKRFLVSAEGSTSPSFDITGTTTTNIDGVCLRCHRDGSSNGVGQSY